MRTPVIVLAMAFWTAASFAAHIEDYREIVLGDEQSVPVSCAIRTAAESLQRTLKEGPGLDLKIVPMSGRKASVHAIFLGRAAAEADGFSVEGFRGWENVIAERKGNVYLFGDDRYVWKGGSGHWQACVLPTVRAVTRFMEKFMGVRFVMPGAAGTEIPRTARVDVKDGTFDREHPLIDFGCNGGRDMMQAIANQCFGRGAYHTYGGHLYPVACPMEKYAKEHPEYFGIVKGRRYCELPNAKNNYAPLCFTNPEVEELIVAELLRRFDEGAEVCQLAQADAGYYCGCERCMSYGGPEVAKLGHGEQIWVFHRHIAERIEKLRPGKVVHIISYGATSCPPQTFRDFPSNVMIEVCNYSDAILSAWQTYGVPHGFTVYTYLWGNYQHVGYTPRHTPAELADIARRFVAHKVHGIYRCGYGELWGLEGPGYYVFNRMLRDPKDEVEAVVDEYCSAAFGPAAATMRAFYGLIDRRLDGTGAAGSNPMDMDGNAEGYGAAFKPGSNLSVLARRWPTDVCRQLGETLAQAEKTAGLSAKQVTRLKLVRLEFDYLRNLSDCVANYEAFRRQASQRTLAPLLESVEERNAMLDRLYSPKTGLVRSLSGWHELIPFGAVSREMLRTNGRAGAVIGAPLCWDTSRVRAAYDVAARRKEDAAKTDLVHLTGWYRTPGFGEPELKIVDGGRSFRLAADKAKHDARVECTFPAEPNAKYRLAWYQKLSGITPAESNGYVRANVSVNRRGKDLITVRTKIPELDLASTDWVRQTLDFETGTLAKAPPYVAVRLLGTDGEAKFADFTVERLKEE